jgi:hypothetical protein
MTKRSQFHRHLRNDILPSRNARKRTGPTTEQGKQRSRCNAVRQGLTAKTVIGALEDAEDYRAFEATITADYDAQSAVERELVLRLASLLWRSAALRRWKPAYLRSKQTISMGLGPTTSFNRPLCNCSMPRSSRAHWSVMTRCPRALTLSPNACRLCAMLPAPIQSPQLRARPSEPL